MEKIICYNDNVFLLMRCHLQKFHGKLFLQLLAVTLVR